MVFGVRNCLFLFPLAAIQAKAKGFLQPKNGACNYYRFRGNHWKITMNEVSLVKPFNFKPETTKNKL